MALSMDEQRMLAEIERRLAAEDPGLAARLSSFKRPGPAARLRTTRGKIIGSLFTVALAAAISLMVYALVPFRAHTYKPASTPQATSASAPAKAGPPASAASKTVTTSTSASAGTPKTAARPSVRTGKTGATAGTSAASG